MPCFHPNIRVKLDTMHACKDGHLTEDFKIFSLKQWNNLPEDFKREQFPKWDKIPCGKCLGCQMSYAKDWAIRCSLEQSLGENDCSYFVTLTYAPEYLPHAALNTRTGELVSNTSHGVLDYQDVVKFNKDLRRYYKYHYNIDNVRFFGAGEYGSLGSRPHYHLIYFNLPIFDLQKDKHSRKGMPLFTSDTLSKIWKKGIVKIGETTFKSSAYTARYSIKKIRGSGAEVEYSSKHQIPERPMMSRRPGIAHDYFITHADEIFKTGSIDIGIGHPVPPPKAFFDALQSEGLYEIEIADLKAKLREQAEASLRCKMAETGLSEIELLQAQERDLRKRVNKLVRQFEKAGL